MNRRASFNKAFSALVATALTHGLTACAPSPETAANLRNLKTDQLILRLDGTLAPRIAESLPGDRKAFVVGVHVNHLKYFGEPEEESAVRLVERSNSIPAECGSGIALIRIGRLEGGGRTIAFRCRE